MSSNRSNHVEKFGKNNDMEAKGIRLLQSCLSRDNSLVFNKSFEGARADFCVVLQNTTKALGVQLKTTGKARKLSIASEQYRFSDTIGYDGLAVICIAMDTSRIWLIPGDEIHSNSIGIPTIQKCQRRHKYSCYETDIDNLPDQLVQILEAQQPQYIFQPIECFIVPASKNRRAEYDAFKRLQQILPLTYVAPDVEQQPYDYTVDGSRWQMKLASYVKTTDRYSSTVQKCAGRLSGKKRAHSQYEQDDFDWLCVQMPIDQRLLYLLPMKVLIERRVAGRLDCGSGHLHMYPHRYAHPKTQWIQNYKIDLSSQEIAIADYQRIIKREST